MKHPARTKRVTVVLSVDMYSELLDYAYLIAKRDMRPASMGELIRELVARELRQRKNSGVGQESREQIFLRGSLPQN